MLSQLQKCEKTVKRIEVRLEILRTLRQHQTVVSQPTTDEFLVQPEDPAPEIRRKITRLVTALIARVTQIDQLVYESNDEFDEEFYFSLLGRIHAIKVSPLLPPGSGYLMGDYL